MEMIIINGNIKSSSEPYLSSNRAFRYGDGVFESIRIINGEPVFFEHHFQRLISGAKALKIIIPESYSLEYFLKQIKLLNESNKIDLGGKARLTLYRDGAGTYKPQNNNAAFLLENESLSNNLYELNREGLIVGTYQEMKKSIDLYSKFKTLNGLLYVVASTFAVENKLDDAFIINESGNIIESTSSNIFIVSNGVLYTPPLEDGCVGGIMRMNIINTALSNKITVYESSLTSRNLLNADEIFLTNSIKGVQWVAGYQNKRYFNKTTKLILDLLNKSISNSPMDLMENLK